MNKAKGNPNRNGKNVWRPDEVGLWYYKFETGKRPYHGSCNTTDKDKAEAIAARLKLEAKYRIKHASRRIQGVAYAAIMTGEPFVLVLASGDCISSVDRRDIASMLREQLARFEQLVA